MPEECLPGRVADPRPGCEHDVAGRDGLPGGEVQPDTVGVALQPGDLDAFADPYARAQFTYVRLGEGVDVGVMRALDRPDAGACRDRHARHRLRPVRTGQRGLVEEGLR